MKVDEFLAKFDSLVNTMDNQDLVCGGAFAFNLKNHVDFVMIDEKNITILVDGKISNIKIGTIDNTNILVNPFMKKDDLSLYLNETLIYNFAIDFSLDDLLNPNAGIV